MSIIEERLIALNEQHEHAIAVFGCAIYAYECARKGDIVGFTDFLPIVAQNARFYGWHESAPRALHRFCHLCMVDPMLIEAYLGVRFEEVVAP